MRTLNKTPNHHSQKKDEENRSTIQSQKDSEIAPAESGQAPKVQRTSSPVEQEKKTESPIQNHNPAMSENTKKQPLRKMNAGTPASDAKESKEVSASEDKRRKIAFWSIIGVTAAVILCFVVYVSFFRVDRIEKTPLSSDQVTFYDPSSALADLTYRVPEGFSYPEGIQDKYKALYAANQNFVGWLSIPNASVDCAVYQADNNSFYLKKDLDGSYSRYGTVFMDAYDDVSDMKRNTVIYGHNFDDDGEGGYEDTIFGDIHQYLDVEFYRTAPVIEFNTIYQDYKWKVIGCFYTNGTTAGDNGYLFYYIATEMNDENFMDFIDEVNQRSYIHTAVDVQPTDKILTLSTCTYFFDRGGSLENARCVLIARMVRDGESEEVDVAAATQNENPRYPQLYYDVFGGENPYRDDSKWKPVE